MRRIIKGLPYITGILLSILLIVSFYYYLLRTPYLKIKEITIEGGRRVGSKEVIDIAGVKIGENILAVDLKAIRRRIEKLPWVREAVVKRVLPHSLKVSIKERVPFALINLDSTLYIIDDGGVVFKKADYRDGVDLPIITGVRMEGLLDGDGEEIESLFKALDFLRFLREKRVLSIESVSEVKMDAHRGLIVYTTEGPMIITFGKGDFDRKIKRLRRLFEVLGDDIKKVIAVDLSYDKKAVVKWRM